MLNLLDYLPTYNPPDRCSQAYYRCFNGPIIRRLCGWLVIANHRNGHGFLGFVWNTPWRQRRTYAIYHQTT